MPTVSPSRSRGGLMVLCWELIVTIDFYAIDPAADIGYSPFNYSLFDTILPEGSADIGLEAGDPNSVSFGG